MYRVWSQIIITIMNLRSIFAADDAIEAGLKNFTLKLVTPTVEKLGWDFASNEDFLTGQLRALIISAAAWSGHQATVTEAQRRFQLYSSGEDKSAIHQNLRLPIFRIVVAEGGKEPYEAIKREYLSTTAVDGKEICLQSLGRAQTPELAKDFVQFLFSDQVAIQDKHSGAMSLATNPKARLFLWEFIKSNWDAVYGKLSGNMVVLDRFLKLSLTKFADHETERDIAKFFEGKDNQGYDRGLGVISDTIKGNANYKDRDGELIKEWLKAHGY